LERDQSLPIWLASADMMPQHVLVLLIAYGAVQRDLCHVVTPDAASGFAERSAPAHGQSAPCHADPEWARMARRFKCRSRTDRAWSIDTGNR